jgi:hypothetical protein
MKNDSICYKSLILQNFTKYYTEHRHKLSISVISVSVSVSV